MSYQLILYGCAWEGVVAKLVSPREGRQVPQQMAVLRYQEESDSEPQHSSTGTDSPDDQRSLSGTDSPYEASPYEELADFQHPIRLLPLSPHLGSPPLDSEPYRSFLTSIPTELHLLIFTHLDPLDSICLGLTNAYFYNLVRALHGVVPLHTHRHGRAWEFHGKQACRHCSAHRCQLHMHLRDWMPSRYEYCAIRQVYGLGAQESAGAHADAGKKGYCYRSNPSKPGRCGRHPITENVVE